MSKEAMKLALEGAANYIDALGGDSRKYRQALANEALDKMAENARELGLDYEPAQQEPVAWMDEFGNVFPLGAQRGPKYLNEPMKPLYTSPSAQRKPLTDEKIFEISNGFVLCMFPVETRTTDRELAFARAIEKAVTRQPQIRPLTDDVMWKLWNSQGDDAMEQTAAITFARAIEAAHGIKENT